jgi:LytS/YehU family sensor histidine kinase
MITIIALIENIAYLLALCFVQRFIIERWPRRETTGKLASGLLYGLVCVVSMNTAVAIVPGVIFDARTVVLSLAGLFSGPFVAVIAGTIAGAYRLYIGGVGSLVGVVTILSSVLLGLVFHHLYRTRLTEISVKTLLLIGITVQLATIVWFYFLPLDFLHDVLVKLAPPYLVLLTLATLFLGSMLREIEKYQQFDILLGQSRDRF